MNKKIYLVGVFILLSLTRLWAQDSIATHVQWQFQALKKANHEYVLTLQATVQPGWRLFSTTAKDDELNTRVVFDSATTANITSQTVSEIGKLQQAKEPLLDNMNIKFFENEATIMATVQVKDGLKKIRGTVTYMVMKGEEIPSPVEAPFLFVINSATGDISVQAGGIQESAEAAKELKRENIDLNNPVNNCGGTGIEDDRSKSLMGIFILGFLGGLIGLLTPCVFPMIPLTVSFFTKQSPSRSKGIFNAVMYGVFILLIYVILSIPFHFVGASNSQVLNTISTNVWLNLFFFIIFVVFALSFFGLFEITMPSGLANKADAKASSGGLIGIFFMALTLALVSFSCTGPILGSLLAGSLSSDGGAMQLTMGMAGFGLALALPFTIFALFPSLLKSLPRSGGWLTSVKIVLGFLELALAVKFLSNADLVEHWGILRREVFFAIWIIIGILLTLYLFGILRFKHEGKPKLTKVRIALGILFGAFTLYLVPGLTNSKYANRSLISGFPPPLTYSIYGKDAFKGVEAQVVNNYQKALQLAKQQSKPVLIDFTGWACVNCRKMEENVWPTPEIKELIEKEYVLVSLYVDDRAKLPADEQFKYTFHDGSVTDIVTVGNVFAAMQSINFVNSSQPLYVLISPDEQLLTRPVGYTPSEKEYLEWLKCGLEAFKKVQKK
ncbi:protein-disulfide reductase DsbD family protein [Paraflavitalea pollutisoli]|uniref:protein-disulfide reductase DsbD family protein n=1 Tax=Paraflavitalea pollutisoli TaxID=3034143 RepID=UPI0023EBCA09|nr:thioredoxin family protein [Paraflavitalea sp. H1-2-19X]